MSVANLDYFYVYVSLLINTSKSTFERYVFVIICEWWCVCACVHGCVQISVAVVVILR